MGNLIVEYSPTYDKLNSASDKNRFIIMVGSSRSGKTYSIIQWLITQCLQTDKPKRVLVCRSKRTWLKLTAFTDFKEILTNQFDMWDERCLNKVDLTYILNGCEWIFLGLDNESGVKKSQGLKCDYLFLNECIDMSYDQFRQVTLRNTGKVIMDLNPNCNAAHWLWKNVANRDKSIVIKSTYKDNPFLSEQEIENIECYEPTPENIARGTADITFWKIYGLGEMAVVTGLVYQNKRYISCFPTEADYVYGLDFGYTNDPTTLIKVAKYKGELYLDEMFYKRGLVNLKNDVQDSIHSEFERLRINKKVPIYCDGAEPKTIEDLRNVGYNLIGVTGANKAILPGIQVVKKYKLSIVDSSMNIINEVDNYKWKESKDGTPTNEVVDKFNHGMDAIRYAAVSIDTKEFNELRRSAPLGMANFKMNQRDYYDIYRNKDLEDDEERGEGMEWLHQNVWRGIM